MMLSDPEAERSYLALCLDMPEALDAGLTIETLSVPVHRVAMACMIAMRQAGEQSSDLVLGHHLQTRGLDRAAAFQVLQAIRSAPSRGIGSLAPVLRRLADARALHELAAAGAAHALAGETDEAREVLARAAFGGTPLLEVFTLRDAMEACAVELQAVTQAMSEQRGNAAWVKLGICPTIDRLITVGPGDTVIFAAETNVGKSGASMTCMLSFQERKIPAGLVSIEDPKIDWGSKAIGHYADVDTAPLWACQATNEHWGKLMKGVGDASSREQFVRFAVAKSGTLAEVVQAMSILVRVHGCRILFIDYIQAIAGPLKNAQPKQQIDHVYMTLQATARQLGVPVVIGSQLSRAQTPGEPAVTRLKESGNLENGAQVILMFWCPDPANWMKVNGKVAKLKRAPTRPKWAMERGHGGVLTEVPWVEPTPAQQPKRSSW